MLKAEDYTYRVFWSERDGAYVATVADTLDEMKESGEVPPQPLAKREYSGNIRLRMPKEQHRRVAMEAAEQGVSINQLLVSRV